MRTLIVTLLLVLPLLLTLTGSSEARECGVYDGIGEACRVEGGYEIALPDGTTLFTHGPDFVPARDAALFADALAPGRAPPCVDEPLTDHHAHFIYAHVSDRPDRSPELMPALRGLVAEANGLLYIEGAELGAPVEYRFLCDEGGAVHVSVVKLPFRAGTAAYSQTITHLRAIGFANPNVKYWLFIDDHSSCTCGGIAAAPLEIERSPLNNANGGPLFGANYGYLGSFGALVGMHENGHNLGAVNGWAPDQSGGAHCNDGQDIMCYPDGGWNSSYDGAVCTDRMHFDCDHDTYFHPDPPAGAYVERRWQLAAPVNRFVEGCLYGQGLVAAPALSVELAIPAECQGHRYAIYGADPTAATGIVMTAIFAGPAFNLDLNKFSVCWYAGATQLACPPNTVAWGHEGHVPAGADRAVVTRLEGPDPTFTLSVI